MAATIHPLFAQAVRADGKTEHPVVSALLRSAREELGAALSRMFDSADDTLFALGEKAGSDTERRRYFDTMRLLRLESGRISERFSTELARGFAPAPAPGRLPQFDLDQLAIQPTEELEEKIAVANLAAKAEGAFRNVLWEIERRLEAAIREGRLPMSPSALSPSRICESFGLAVGGLDCDFQLKLVVYKLFERVLMRALDHLYAESLRILDAQGLHTPRHGAAPSSSGRDVRNVSTPTPPASHGPLPPPAPDASAGVVPAAHGAAELAQILGRLLGPGAASGAALAGTGSAAAQRLALAGRLIEEVLAEPLLPERLRPAIESLRLPVYRSALSDGAFFVDPAHPLRRLLTELAEVALGVHDGRGGDGALDRLHDGLDLAARGSGPLASELIAGAQPVSASEIENFLHQVREQTRIRRESVLRRVRGQVAQDLRTHLLGREPPAPVLRLLNAGVGPLMAVRLLRNGRDSPPFRQAEDLVERILGSLDEGGAPTMRMTQRETLMTQIVESLRDIGMAPDKIESLLEGLREVYRGLEESDESEPAGEVEAVSANRPPGASNREPPRPAHEPAADAPAERNAHANAAPQAPDDDLPRVTLNELLARLLTPESWFRVYDAEHGRTRWLKLVSFYAHQDSVSFSGFDESSRFNLRASRLAADLAGGLSEPINPDSTAREALQQLQRARARGRL